MRSGHKKKYAIKNTIELSKDKIKSNFSVVQDLINSMPTCIPHETVAEFAAAVRVLPPGTPYPGPWQNQRTPYAVEIMNELSARSHTQEITWIKCSQIGATSIVENFIAYIVRRVPGPILYVTAKEDLLKKWVNKRLSPLAISCALEFFAQHKIGGQRRTGNQMLSKEFAGGTLDMVSAQSESNLRQDSVRYLILDEAGAYPWDVQGFGDPIAIARARTSNWRSRRKIFIPSTPGIEGDCRMWSLYQEGDQRRYFIACTKCGERQVLRMPSEPDAFYENFASTKLQWETRAGYLEKDTIHFICHKCKHVMRESEKWGLVQSGWWMPTAKSESHYKKSYQIGRVYSLMEDWFRIVQIEIKAAGDPLALQAHHNHNCGIPYRETTARVDRARVYELRGTYESQKIPSDKILFLTAAVDVQRGRDDNPDYPARVEMEVCGHGIGYRTWSIDYQVFEGAVDDAYSGAWESLYQFFNNHKCEYRRSDGVVFSPAIIFVDSNDNKTETTVFDFCTRAPGLYPIKGAADLKETMVGRQAAQTLDAARPRDRDRFRLNSKLDTPYVMIATNWYKRRLYQYIKTSIARKALGQEGNTYCAFPQDYPDKYFDQLVAEEERADRSFWKPSHRANEALDLRVYNLCACEFWLWLEVRKKQIAARRAGMTKAQSEYIHSRHVLADYERVLQRKKTRE
jgi:phage terminase large subunit GpA-like protein